MGESKGCTRCGAPGAELFANDGALVCDRCFAYDQVVTGELRASQVDLGVTPTGEGEGLVEATRRKGRIGVGAGVALFAIGGYLFSLGGTYEIAMVVAAVLVVLGVLALVQGFRLLRFAKVEAPVVVKRLSSRPPPPNKDAITVPQTRL